MKKSKVITFIGGFYIFGGIISFLSLLLGGSPLNTVFDLPDIPDYVVKFLLAIIYIPAGYGAMSIPWTQKVELFSQHSICRENYFLCSP